MPERKAIWEPQPKQMAFMRRKEYEALYGGAAGGGKSDALVIEALRQVSIPYYKALIVRKTFPQLRELIDKAYRYYPAAVPGASYNSSEHIWRFPSGAQILFGSMQHESDRTRYQGQAYDLVEFDELTHFTFNEYSYLFSRNRPNGPGTRVYIRSSCNPGGVGHGWVKDRFITPAPPLTPIPETVAWTAPDGQVHEGVQHRIYVPATVFDNRILLENDPRYVQRLASMPEAERNALLYGDWDSFTGQVFIEWRNNPAHYGDRVGTHVIDPFRVPQQWKIYCGLDWGYSRPFSVHWYAVDFEKRIYCIRELYGCTGTPNVGVQWEPTRLADEIKAIEADDPNLKDKRILRVGDPAIWASDGGKSIGAMMEERGVYFSKGDHARLSGLMQVHHRLSFDGDGVPMLYVFSTCKNMIRTLPALVYDETNVEDVDTDGEDHAYDELRYVCMANLITPRQEAIVQPREYNPLSDYDYYKTPAYDRYDFYRRT